MRGCEKCMKHRVRCQDGFEVAMAGNPELTGKEKGGGLMEYVCSVCQFRGWTADKDARQWPMRSGSVRR